MKFPIILNKTKVLNYRYCKKCGVELSYKREEITFDRHSGIVTKYKFIRRCPHYICFMGVVNGHDYWSWTTSAKNDISQQS